MFLATDGQTSISAACYGKPLTFFVRYRMSFSDILGIIGVLLGIAGLAYAVYQTNEKRKLQEFVRSQSWYVFSKANNVTGIAQAALRTYKQSLSQNQNIEILELLAKTDAFGQDLFRETIRQIQLNEPLFTRTQIVKWVADGKLDKDHAPLFEQLCISERVVPNNSVKQTS